MKKVISIILAVLMAVSLTFALSGCGKSDKQKENTYSGMQNIEALIDYAERLEAAGNTEAAAQVWALIPAAAQDAAADDSKQIAENSPEMKAAHAANEASELADALSNEGGK